MGQGKTIICLVMFKAMNRLINKHCGMKSLSVLIECFVSRNVQLKRLEKWTDPFPYSQKVNRDFYVSEK
uniref:Uncharacterized protein n=1 Tax=Wuchereria bancrofti TaxID=6293 RepID=A0AAF5PTT7_WUCBA